MNAQLTQHTIDDALGLIELRQYREGTVGECTRLIRLLREQLTQALSSTGRGQYLIEDHGEQTAVVFEDGSTSEAVAYIDHRTDRAAQVGEYIGHEEAFDALERAGFEVVMHDGDGSGTGCPVCNDTQTVISSVELRRTAPVPHAGMGDVEEMAVLGPCPLCGPEVQ